MSRYGVVNEGVVTNVVISDAEFAARQGWIAVPDNVGVGWSHDEQSGGFSPPAPPELPEPPAPVVVLYPADLWRRTTDGEAEAIEGAMAQQPVRLRNLFRSAQTYQSDDPLWPILTAAATQLFGADRAAELLAASA